MTSIDGDIIGWGIPPKSKLYTKPIKYKNEYISICYDCFLNHREKVKNNYNCMLEDNYDNLIKTTDDDNIFSKGVCLIDIGSD